MRFFNRALTGLFLSAVTFGLLSLAVGLIWSSLQERMGDQGSRPPARERVFAAEVLTLTPQSLRPELTAFGEILPRRSLELRAAIGGRVVELAPNFREGGRVEEGALLVRIDPAEAEWARDTAAADLQDAEAQEDLRRRALERARDLADRGVGSLAAVEAAELAVASASQATLARRQALADAERRLADTEIRAGFAGVLSEVDLAQGRLLSANEQFGRLLDPDQLEVAFRLSTAQYARLVGEDGRLPQVDVELRIDLGEQVLTLPARLTRESGAVGEGQTGRLLFADVLRPAGLQAGDFVTVHVTEPALEGVMIAPATALADGAHVLVLGDEDRLEDAEVTLLRRQGDDVIFRADHLAGREIVAARTPVLGAGIKVDPLRPTADGSLPEVVQDEELELDPERRARLIAYVEGNSFIPDDVKSRLLDQLNQPRVPSGVVARLEERMGG